MSTLTWQNVSETRPGYSIWQCQVGDRTYVAQMKAGIGMWRLFVREGEKDPLRTIFIGDKLKDCKERADIYEETQ